MAEKSGKTTSEDNLSAQSSLTNFLAKPSQLDDAPTYDWDSFSPSLFCVCFNFVLQCVFVGALISLVFGINLSNFNTSQSSIFSLYEQCGSANETYKQFWGYDATQCQQDPLCFEACGVRDGSSQNTLTAVRCPGGHNDVTCHEIKWYAAFLSSSVLMGAVVGALLGGKLMELGRRIVLLITLTIYVFGIITCMCANTFSSLIWGRLVIGVAVGLSSVTAPTYMSEMTRPANRGKYGVIHQLSIVTGQVFAMTLGVGLTDPAAQDDHWTPSRFQHFWLRLIIGFPIIFIVIAYYFLLCVYTFDTPIYYVEKKRYRDAEMLLKLIYNKENVSEELNLMMSKVESAQDNKAKGGTFFKTMKYSEFRHVMIIGILISLFQQFGGINVFMTSSADIFKKAGLTGELQTLMSIVMALLLWIFTLPSIYLIDKLGRKTLLLFGSTLQFLFVIPATICYWLDPDPSNPLESTQTAAIVARLFSVLGFTASFAIAFGPVVWVYIFEIFPLEIKDVAASIVTGFNWTGAIVMVFAAALLPNKYSFTVFASLQFLATLFILFFVRETKGRALGDTPYVTRGYEQQRV